VAVAAPLQHGLTLLPRAKVWAEQALYAPLGRDIIGALRLCAAQLVTNDSAALAPQERLYATDYVRGFTRRSWRAYGGSSLIAASAELRFPLVGSVGGVLFQDGARVFPGNYAESALLVSGFGVRYVTAVGTLRFDLGIPWQRYGGLPPVVWCCTVGQAF
jgi:outer membrane protein assembly factor BamA